MTAERLQSIEKKLDEHSSTLREIQKTLNLLAVQNEQISAIQEQLATIWRKYDMLTNPQNGIVTVMSNFQASCPRHSMKTHIKLLWGSLAPLIFTQIGIAIKLLK